MKGKITHRTEARPWENPKGGTIFYRSYTLDNGTTLNLGGKEAETKWNQVGMEIEYEQSGTDSKGNPKYKRVTGFQMGGGKPRTKSFTDIQRMCKSNALSAMVTVNGNYEEERITSKALASIVNFTLGGITTDIELFGEEDSLLTSRLSAINNAAAAAKFKSFASATDFMALAAAYYGYIKG